jgi:serine protease Do
MFRVFKYKPAVAFLIGTFLGLGAVADGIHQEIYQKIDADLFPAICKITFISETTNTNSGEKTRRSSYTQGILVSKDGLVLAYGHMLLENREPLNIKVTVGQGEDEEEYDAVYLTKPDDINVNFLKIETDDDTKFPFVKFNSESKLELGESFLVTGLLNANFDFAKIIQSHRVGAILTEPRLTYTLDSTVTFGFIGGPVVNGEGQTIGVIGLDMSANEGGEIYTRSGYPLIYQASLFQDYIDNPPNSEKSAAYLGVYMQPLSEDFAEYWNLPDEGGVVVSTVVSDSPAYKAGFKPGDVISKFNNETVTAKLQQDVVSFTKLVRESPMNEPLPIEFYRDGKPMKLKLTLTARPTDRDDASTHEAKILGITARELTRDVRTQFNMPDETQGVVITAVKSGSPASLARLRRNYLIQAIGNIQIENLDDFKAAIESLSKAKPQEIPVFCRIGANTAFFRLRPRWDK